jgi:hypothetical protein
MKPFLVATAIVFALSAGASAASAATASQKIASKKSCIKVKKYEVVTSPSLGERVTYRWVRVCYR